MRTKVVATIGPATAEPDRIEELAAAGVDVFRLNMAHGTHDDHARAVEWVRAAADRLDRPIALLADLAGPKIRVGTMPESRVLQEGEVVVLAPETVATADELPTTYAELASDVSPGSRVLLDDGMLELRVEEVEPPRIRCRVLIGGTLLSNKGINLPGVQVSAPALTDKDIQDLEFILKSNVDYVGLSYVQRPEDVADLRRRLPPGPLIVAKIEKDVALDNLEAILAETDAVMVARGDLGVELRFEQVPMAQKRIIELAHRYNRPVITATQMLESMIVAPRPTRAEASDVANAVFDGTDAVMLSGETAIGRYPLLAVEAMVRIAGEIDRSQGLEEYSTFGAPGMRQLRAGATPTEHAIAASAREAVRLLGAPAIVCFTRTGFTARLVSSYRPPVPVLGVSDSVVTYRQLALVWGVHPVLCRPDATYETLLEVARAYLLERGMARPAHRVVVTAGVPFHVRGTTNMLRIEEL